MGKKIQSSRTFIIIRKWVMVGTREFTEFLSIIIYVDSIPVSHNYLVIDTYNFRQTELEMK